jgi:iron complex outermembrane receptor protein
LYDAFNYHQVAPYIAAENFANALNVPSWTGGEVNDRYSAYISNVIDLLPALHVMTSVRYEYSKDRSPDPTLPNTSDKNFSFNQGAWTPKFGVVYELLPDELSLFGNYMGGTRNVNNFLAADGNSGKMQKAVPERARQWEGGVKSDLFAHKLSLMISYFDITVDDKLRTDPSNQLFSLQDGTQRNKGLELELFANPFRGMDIQAGYAFLDAKFLNGTDEGKRPAYAPKNTFNYWLSYGIPQGRLAGAGLGLGGNYRDDSFISSDNSLTIPGVHTLNATVFYDQPKYRLALKADNLTNEVYWGDYLNPQPPLTIRAAVSFKW